MKESKKPKIVELVKSTYQPSRAELREDLCLQGTFKEAIQALVKPAKIRKVIPKKGSE